MSIRNSWRKNLERLLLVAGANDDLYLTISPGYKMPIGKTNKLVVSIHYYEPYDYTLGINFEPYNWTNDNGYIITYGPTLIWVILYITIKPIAIIPYLILSFIKIKN